MLLDVYDTNIDDELGFIYEDFSNCVIQTLKTLKYPRKLIAYNSNWQGQTGVALVNSSQEVLQKVCSFDGSYIEFHKSRNSYEFVTATHDAPTGFTIALRSINYKVED